MAKKPMKGVAGKNTGAKTRAAINSAQKKGCTLKEIGAASNRSPSVISAIKSGDIKNPPADVAAAVQKGCTKAKASK